MLPKASRVTTKEWKGVRARPVYRGALFDLSTAEGATTKFACVIAKKRIRRAVDRNKARRRMFAALEGISLSSPKFVFVYPTKHILQAPFPTLKEETIKAFATL
jgi:ribonuclease P protein component